MTVSKHAVLLINLGTPDDLSPRAIRRYLREFLHDPRVIDLPRLVRWVLVNGLVIPFRHRKTRAAYQKIWHDQGSPLLMHSANMQRELATLLGDNFDIALGMRYGKPDITSAIQSLGQHDSLLILPLFPQYSSAANGSAIESALNALKNNWNLPKIKIVNDFCQDPGFIKAYATLIREHVDLDKIDKLVFSYHGLPVRHIRKSKCRSNCDHVAACPAMEFSNRFCYRAQCYATTRAIAQALGLNESDYVVSFQSRLGRTPWIKPYTDLVLPELAQQGVKNIAVVSPSFVADCLETLEEINIRAREQWQTLGGQSFHCIPCLNDHPLWIKALADMITTLSS